MFGHIVHRFEISNILFSCSLLNQSPQVQGAKGEWGLFGIESSSRRRLMAFQDPISPSSRDYLRGSTGCVTVTLLLLQCYKTGSNPLASLHD